MEHGANTEHFDAIVIGTGQGGKPLALELAEAGYQTAVIERAAVGGTCVNYGCTPTKTMVASARIAWLARRAADFGIDIGPVSVNMERVRQRKRSLVEMFRTSGEKSLEQAENLELIRGEASFIEAKSLQVQLAAGGARYLTAKRIIINTGLQPVRPPIDGLDRVRTLDNVSIMELDEVPRHLLVLGGGYVGLEFAQMFRRFGSKVTIIDRGEQLLKQEDPDIAEELVKILREDGIEVLLRTSARKVREDRDGALHLEIDVLDGPRTVTGTHLLVAVGRAPATEALRLDAAGIETDEKGFVRVNARLETNEAGVFAIGDVKGGPAFTHVSYNDYLVLKTNLLHGGDSSIDGRPILTQAAWREDAIEAVAECHRAGIQVKLITGDHVSTAKSIAARFWMCSDEAATVAQP